MLSYPIEEAETLLEGRLSAAKQSLSNCEEDLDFLREQITVSSPPSFMMRRVIDFKPRPWRLPLPECTTGMSYRRGKRRQRRERKRAKAKRKMIHQEVEERAWLRFMR